MPTGNATEAMKFELSRRACPILLSAILRSDHNVPLRDIQQLFVWVTISPTR